MVNIRLAHLGQHRLALKAAIHHPSEGLSTAYSGIPAADRSAKGAMDERCVKLLSDGDAGDDAAEVAKA